MSRHIAVAYLRNEPRWIEIPYHNGIAGDCIVCVPLMESANSVPEAGKLIPNAAVSDVGFAEEVVAYSPGLVCDNCGMVVSKHHYDGVTQRYYCEPIR